MFQYFNFIEGCVFQLFVVDNQSGSETTVIQHLAFYGTPRDATNMAEFKRVAGDKGERHS